MSPQKRRLFTDEHKAEAVRIVLASDKSMGQVAREMDLTQSALRYWVRQAQANQKQAPKGALRQTNAQNCCAYAVTLSAFRWSATS